MAIEMTLGGRGVLADIGRGGVNEWAMIEEEESRMVGADIDYASMEATRARWM